MSALLGAITSRLGQSVRALPSAVWNRAVTSLTTTTGIGNNAPLATTWCSWQHQQTRFGSFQQYVNLPPVHRLAGKGDAYATKVDRRRVLKDPNEPNFVHIEPLKWTTWGMLRDCRRRHMFTRYYFKRHILYNARKCRMLPTTVREAAFEEEQALPRESKISMMHQRCAITGRTRGILKKYRLSRLVWRNLADYNKLSGVIKAVW